MNATQTNETLIAYCAATARARTARMLATILATEGRKLEAEQATRNSIAAWARANKLASLL